MYFGSCFYTWAVGPSLYLLKYCWVTSESPKRGFTQPNTEIMSLVIYLSKVNFSQLPCSPLCPFCFGWEDDLGVCRILMTHTGWIDVDIMSGRESSNIKRRSVMFCLELVSHCRLSLYQGTKLGDKLRASFRISILVSVPFFWVKPGFVMPSGVLILDHSLSANCVMCRVHGHH